MRFLVECWRDKHRFHANDPIPASHDYTCPKCGAGCRKIIFTKEQVKKNMPYYHIGMGEVVRIRTEANYFLRNGHYIRDPITKKPRKIDEVIVNAI